MRELQERLAGSGTAVLEIVALPEELITFAISGDDAIVARRPRRNEALAPLAEACLTESGTTAAAALYDDVIRPAGAVLDRARSIVIIPDRLSSPANRSSTTQCVDSKRAKLQARARFRGPSRLLRVCRYRRPGLVLPLVRIVSTTVVSGCRRA
jgi:hypothetical protein